MYEFAKTGWDDPLARNMRIWAYGYDVEIDIENWQGPGGPLPLRTNHVVLALYEVVVAMSTSVRFFEVAATISIQRRRVGVLKMERLRPINIAHDQPEGINESKPETTKSIVNAPSGTVIDQDDPRFTISYAYSGARINSKDVFIAILEALAITAEYTDTLPFHSLATTSASRKCMITFSDARSGSKLHYSFITQALRILTWDVIIALKLFGEMTLQLLWDGQKIAEGNIKPLSPSSDSAFE